VTAGLLSILEEEGFFENGRAGGDAWTDGDAGQE
jgi:hypothetical protein